MQTYYLHTLLCFLRSQKALDYEAIEIIIGIMEDDVLENEDKMDGIRFILRKHGLNEITHKDGRFDPIYDKCKLQEDKMWIQERGRFHECFVTQLVSVYLLDGKLLFEIPLN
jgi:hypothetical protein